jgi:hypothetical protein
MRLRNCSTRKTCAAHHRDQLRIGGPPISLFRSAWRKTGAAPAAVAAIGAAPFVTAARRR